MSEINVILAPMAGRTVCTAKTVYQYNQGMVLRLLGIDLPQAYTVDFANSVTGSSISQVGSADGVSIPDQFFVPGSTIHAWVVITGTGYAVTRYHIMIPISPRAVRTNETPTPSQQSALDEAIAALNEAVTDAEAAASHYPKIEGGYWMVWDVEAGEYVSTGVQAQGPQGIQGVQGIQGPAGADGSNGADGADGTTFTPAVSAEGVISWTNDGGKTNPSPVNIKGPQGETGATGQTGATGPAGADGVGVPAGGTAGQVLSKASGTDYDTEWTTPSDSPVQDVQVNGTSVLSDGVANVPVADLSTIGAFKTQAFNGFKVNQSGDFVIDNVLTLLNILPGNSSYKYAPISTQHITTFVGLAKAAGADMKDISGVTVGIYPEAQKSAISQMLNSPVTVSGSTDPIIALPGVQYVCGERATLDITLPASGCVDVVFESGSTPTVLTVTPPTGMTVEWSNGFDPTSLDANTTYEINIKMVGTKCLGVAGQWT